MAVRIVIVGGGFGGVYTAKYLEKHLRAKREVEITLINRENYFVFQPLLPEVVSGNVGILDTVSSLRSLLRRTRIYVREVERIDLQEKRVILAAGLYPHSVSVPYDHLVLALGNVTDFRGLPGLHEHALPFKNVADAIHLRNHLLHVLEEASIEQDPEPRRELLTFVVAGGGFSGVEVAAEINDFLRRVVRRHFPFPASNVRVVLVHTGPRVLDRELEPALSEYATAVLQRRGVELLLNRRLKTASPRAAVLDNDERIPTRTLVSTVPSFPHPLIDALPVPKQRGRVEVDEYMRVKNHTDVWALGDCALVPIAGTDQFCPPTAQHAVRQAKVLAGNLAAVLENRRLQPFRFRGLGKLGALGHHRAVAQLPLGIRLSGFPAWFLWRTIYWWKLPGISRKVRVGISWFLDLFFTPDLSQLKLNLSQGVGQAHYEPGEYIFRQGDLGDALYIISQGSVEVIQELEHPKGRTQRVLATLGPGEIFGELALLQQTSRTASVRCLTGVDVLVVRRGEFGMLAAGLTAFRENLQRLATQRLEREKSLDAVARPVATEERASEIRQHDPDRHMPPPKNQSEG